MSQTFQQSLAACAQQAGVAIGREASEQLEAYYEILRRWNDKVSLTSLPLAGYPAASLNRLLIEPVIAAGLIPPDSASLLDIGSGGGSPAIPVKILRPELSLTMTEGRERKVAFLREAASVLGLVGVDVVAGRLENQRSVGHFDCVTLRAVRVDEALVSILRDALAPSGRLLLFGSPEASNNPFFSEIERRPLPGGSVVQAFEVR